MAKEQPTRARPSLEKTRYPGVFKRGAKYTFVWRDQNGKQRWGTEATLDAARKEKARREATHHYSDTVTLYDYAIAWVERYQGRTSRGFREITRDEYRSNLKNHVLPLLGKRIRLVDVRPRTISDLVAAMAKAKKDDGSRRLADRTIKKLIAPLRACLATAVEEGLIGSNPCAGVRLPVRPQIEEDDDAKVKALTTEELAQLLACAPVAWRDLLLLLAVTGLRISEALALRWQDLELDGDRPVVKVRRRYRKGTMEAPKSRYARRDVPMARSLVDAMRARKSSAAPKTEAALIWSNPAGEPWGAERLLRDSVKLAAAEAGVGWATFHTLRHTCATRLFAAGRNAKQVQHWLGHHSPSFTVDTYIHLMDGDLGEPLDAPVLEPDESLVVPVAAPAD